MSESFLQKAKADGQVFVKTVSLLSKISKAKLDIRARERERQKVLSTIGGAIFEIYNKSGTIDEQAALSAVGKHFENARRIDDEMEKLQAEIERLKLSFKHGYTDEDEEEEKEKE